MKSELIWLALALFTGALIPIQAATNTAFSKNIGNPFITGLMVFVIGLAAMLIFVLVSRTAFPPAKQLVSAPLYSYLGGLIVAAYVVSITMLVPRIGVGAAIAFIVTGQIICAVVIDHFGLFNLPVRHISTARISGILLMIGGIYLVMRK